MSVDPSKNETNPAPAKDAQAARTARALLEMRRQKRAGADAGSQAPVKPMPAATHGLMPESVEGPEMVPAASGGLTVADVSDVSHASDAGGDGPPDWFDQVPIYEMDSADSVGPAGLTDEVAIESTPIEGQIQKNQSSDQSSEQSAVVPAPVPTRQASTPHASAMPQMPQMPPPIKGSAVSHAGSSDRPRQSPPLNAAPALPSAPTGLQANRPAGMPSYPPSAGVRLDATSLQSQRAAQRQALTQKFQARDSVEQRKQLKNVAHVGDHTYVGWDEDQTPPGSMFTAEQWAQTRQEQEQLAGGPVVLFEFRNAKQCGFVSVPRQRPAKTRVEYVPVAAGAVVKTPEDSSKAAKAGKAAKPGKSGKPEVQRVEVAQAGGYDPKQHLPWPIDDILDGSLVLTPQATTTHPNGASFVFPIVEHDGAIREYRIARPKFLMEGARSYMRTMTVTKAFNLGALLGAPNPLNDQEPESPESPESLDSIHQDSPQDSLLELDDRAVSRPPNDGVRQRA